MKTTALDCRGAWRVLAAASLALAALGAFAQAKLPTARIEVAGHPLKVEVAATPEALARGLMFRDGLGRDEGMLFVHEEPAYLSMWMKNTRIPLSVAFVDAAGAIVSIHDMQPHTLDSHMSRGPALYAIETNLGWFAERRIGPGAKVTGLPRKRP